MIVEATEARVRVSLRHDDCRMAVAASDVRDEPALLQLLLDASERGNPRTRQVAHVAGAEESRGADEEVWVVVAPEDASALLECLRDLRLRARHSLDDVEASADVEGALLVRERHGLFGREVEASARRFVGDVAARRLIDEPLTHVALDRPRALGKLGGSLWPTFGQSLVEAEPLAYVDECGAERRAEVADDLAHEGV